MNWSIFLFYFFKRDHWSLLSLSLYLCNSSILDCSSLSKICKKDHQSLLSFLHLSNSLLLILFCLFEGRSSFIPDALSVSLTSCLYLNLKFHNPVNFKQTNYSACDLFTLFPVLLSFPKSSCWCFFINELFYFPISLLFSQFETVLVKWLAWMTSMWACSVCQYWWTPSSSEALCSLGICHAITSQMDLV